MFSWFLPPFLTVIMFTQADGNPCAGLIKKTCLGSTVEVNEAYEYTRSKSVPIPFLKNLDPEQLPSQAFNDMAAAITNNSLVRLFIESQDPTWSDDKFSELIRDISQEISDMFPGKRQRVNNLKEYFKTFVDKPIPPGFVIDTPEDEYVVRSAGDLDSSKTTVSDEAFGEYRVSGSNPSAIALCSMEYLERLGLGQDPEALALLNKQRLFVVDFSAYAYANPSRKTVDSLQKYTIGSIGLFKAVKISKYEKLQLQPFCIQLISPNQTMRLVYPKNNDVKWKTAKSVFQSNDASYSLFSHLAGTHFVVESFLVATYRVLPKGHPLYVLLDKHFEVAAFVNELAVDYILANGSFVDTLYGQDVATQLPYLALFTQAITAKNMTFPARIKERGMDLNPSLNYPYRDDGMLLWGAISKWVDDYLRVFYKTHRQVLTDKFTCAWLSELESISGGNVKWIDSLPLEESNARDSLASLVTSIIFIASVEHSVMNFPGRSLVQNTGAFPLALYAGDGVVFKPKPTEADLMCMFPPLKAARLQAQLLQVSGCLRYSRLGYYDTCNGKKCVGKYFLDNVKMMKSPGYKDQVVHALKSFHRKLEDISDEIKRRNKKRKRAYVEMIPSGITQSPNS